MQRSTQRKAVAQSCDETLLLLHPTSWCVQPAVWLLQPAQWWVEVLVVVSTLVPPPPPPPLQRRHRPPAAASPPAHVVPCLPACPPACRLPDSHPANPRLLGVGGVDQPSHVVGGRARQGAKAHRIAAPRSSDTRQLLPPERAAWLPHLHTRAPCIHVTQPPTGRPSAAHGRHPLPLSTPAQEHLRAGYHSAWPLWQ